MTQDEYRQIRRLRAAKMSIMAIAKKMGRHTYTISTAIRDMGLAADLRNDPNAKMPEAKPDDAFAVKLFRLWVDKSLSVSDIARHMGISDKRVYEAAKRYGLPTRERRCVMYRDDPEEVTREEDQASAESLELSPYVQARIRELRIGMPVAS